jgi:hypothetical protein
MRRYTKTDLALLSTDLSAKLPVPKPRRKNEEWEIQSAFFARWRSASLGVWHGLMFHVPNGSVLGSFVKERVIRAKMLALAGVKNGVCDCFLSAARGRWHGMYVEFKRPSERNKHNGGCSDDQVEFMAYAMGGGYKCIVAYSVDEAWDAVTNYLKQT